MLTTSITGEVARPDRDYVSALAEAEWSGPAVRDAHMAPLLIAQVGTLGADRAAWVALVVEGTTRRIVPLALRAAASVAVGEHGSALLEEAERCEQRGTAREAAHAATVAAEVSERCAPVRGAPRDDKRARGTAAYAAGTASGSARSASFTSAPDAALSAALAATTAATASGSIRAARAAADAVLIEAVAIAMAAYRAEGRTT